MTIKKSINYLKMNIKPIGLGIFFVFLYSFLKRNSTVNNIFQGTKAYFNDTIEKTSATGSTAGN